ncbi:MAG: hypothetical protein IJ529_06060 [Alphaproteobacteria bacterium]|nr:hypothetical protein [Alphaproteobacteria bacterium]MBQ8678014.1 hypothetical protein [Alphaproteobacteria bacterium]
MINDSLAVTAAQVKEAVYYNRDIKASKILTPASFFVLKEIEYFINRLATNKIQFVDKDPRLAYKLCEKLVREAGYDKNGIYSKSARHAMIVLGSKQRILAYRAPLIDRKVSWLQKIQNKFIDLAQKYIFTQDCVAGDGSKISVPGGIMDYSFYKTNIEQQKPTLWQKVKQFGKRHLAKVAFVLCTTFAFNPSNSKEMKATPQQFKRIFTPVQNTPQQKILNNKLAYFNAVRQAQVNQSNHPHLNKNIQLSPLLSLSSQQRQSNRL